MDVMTIRLPQYTLKSLVNAAKIQSVEGDVLTIIDGGFQTCQIEGVVVDGFTPQAGDYLVVEECGDICIMDGPTFEKRVVPSDKLTH